MDRRSFLTTIPLAALALTPIMSLQLSAKEFSVQESIMKEAIRQGAKPFDGGNSYIWIGEDLEKLLYGGVVPGIAGNIPVSGILEFPYTRFVSTPTGYYGYGTSSVSYSVRSQMVISPVRSTPEETIKMGLQDVKSYLMSEAKKGYTQLYIYSITVSMFNQDKVAFKIRRDVR